MSRTLPPKYFALRIEHTARSLHAEVLVLDWSAGGDTGPVAEYLARMRATASDEEVSRVFRLPDRTAFGIRLKAVLPMVDSGDKGCESVYALQNCFDYLVPLTDAGNSALADTLAAAAFGDERAKQTVVPLCVDLIVGTTAGVLGKPRLLIRRRSEKAYAFVHSNNGRHVDLPIKRLRTPPPRTIDAV
jgi:hypothetical protein